MSTFNNRGGSTVPFSTFCKRYRLDYYMLEPLSMAWVITATMEKNGHEPIIRWERPEYEAYFWEYARLVRSILQQLGEIPSPIEEGVSDSALIAAQENFATRWEEAQPILCEIFRIGRLPRYTVSQLDGSDQYVITDNHYGVTLTFRRYEFNESQQVEINNERMFSAAIPLKPQTVMSDLADWMTLVHPELLYRPKFEWVDNRTLRRNTKPKLELRLDDDCDDRQLVAVLKKMIAHIKNYGRNG